ncbi:MAG: hypothetical protein CSB01_04560, partial [Bacteroidia bacterium]
DSLRSEYGELVFDVKNINSLIYLLAGDGKISNNTTLKARYSFKEPFFSLSFSANFLKIKEYVFHKIRLDATGKESLKTHFTIDWTKLAEGVGVRKFSLQSTLQNNKMQTISSWGDSIIPSHKGSFLLNSVFSETVNNRMHITNILKPSSFLFDGKTWQVHEAEINVDITALSFKDFQISTQDQYLKANGMLSGEGNSLVNVDLKDIEIGHIWNVWGYPSTKLEVGHIWNVWGYPSTKLEGKISGYAKYLNDGKSHTLQSDLKIPQLRIENQDLGEVAIHSDWDKLKNNLNSKAVLRGDNQDLFTLEGSYGLNNDRLNYTASFNQFDLSLVGRFAKEYVRKIEGTIDGALKIQGKADSPKMEGTLDFDIPKIT